MLQGERESLSRLNCAALSRALHNYAARFFKLHQHPVGNLAAQDGDLDAERCTFEKHSFVAQLEFNFQFATSSYGLVHRKNELACEAVPVADASKQNL